MKRMLKKMICKILGRKTREEKILESCGNICFCNKCKEPLNDTSEVVKLHDSGLYEYTCIECSTKNKFHFGIAPVPIFIE